MENSRKELPIDAMWKRSSAASQRSWKQRKSWWNLHLHASIAPLVLLAIGVCNLLPYLLVQQLIPRLIQVLIFYLLASSEKRLKLRYYLFLLASVLIFFLFIPNGRVLFSIGPFKITEIALYEGLFRGLTLIGYVFFSLWVISPSLKIPGKIGELISISLVLFSLMFEKMGATMSTKRGKKKRILAHYVDRELGEYISSYLVLRGDEQFQKHRSSEAGSGSAADVGTLEKAKRNRAWRYLSGAVLVLTTILVWIAALYEFG